jgi:DNA replication protein DnaC
MTHEETIQKLIALKMMAMVALLREWLAGPPTHGLTFEEQLALLVDREWTERKNRQSARRIKDARLPVQATLEDLWSDPSRGLERAVVRSLATGQWIRAKQNVIATGLTGTGKSYFATALAHGACRQGFRALCVRAPRLVQQLGIARADGTYPELLSKLARVHVLVVDDFLISPMTETEKRDLLEVLEDRYGHTSTVITSQVPTRGWHEALGDPTLADAICDRLVHNAHVIALRGPSMRKKKGMGPEGGSEGEETKHT